MPIYDYICPKCKNRFEELVSKQRRDNVICELCNITAERQISCCAGSNTKLCAKRSCVSCAGCKK